MIVVVLWFVCVAEVSLAWKVSALVVYMIGVGIRILQANVR